DERRPAQAQGLPGRARRIRHRRRRVAQAADATFHIQCERSERQQMYAAHFRAAQPPLKTRYATDAKAAFLTLKARGAADASTVTCRVDTGLGIAIAGIHPKCGGSGLELCSGDMLLEALVACAGVSLKAAAAVLDIPI